jgi:hypothetical protein
MFMPPMAVMDHVLDVADGQAVAGDGFAVDVEVEVVAAHDPLGVGAERALDRRAPRPPPACRSLELGQVRAGDLDADRGLDAGGEHVDAGLDRHGPGVGQAGELDRLVELVGELLGGHARRHSLWGLSMMVVSIIDSGAGSVAVSARPILPKT